MDRFSKKKLSSMSEKGKVEGASVWDLRGDCLVNGDWRGGFEGGRKTGKGGMRGMRGRRRGRGRGRGKEG